MLNIETIHKKASNKIYYIKTILLSKEKNTRIINIQH